MDRFPFRFCPCCGAEGIDLLRGHEFRCPSCGFIYFHNVASAVGAIVVHGDSFLCLVRAKEPRRGKLCLPGGFVDPGEGAEEALRRECLEETALEISGIAFIGGYHNVYEYAGVPYRTCDFFFTATAAPGSAVDGSGFPAVKLDLSESLEARWSRIEELDMDEIAFPSMRRALGDWRASLG
jgi:ADP-ribose pyrophosphatase YjhB (NUDIX family)